jgi:predicted GNAT family acetyltransferase
MLVEEVLQMIKQEGERVVPLCGFVAGYIEKHPRWMSLVAEGIKEV